MRPTAWLVSWVDPAPDPEFAAGSLSFDWHCGAINRAAELIEAGYEAKVEALYTLAQLEDAWSASVPLGQAQFKHFAAVLSEQTGGK